MATGARTNANGQYCQPFCTPTDIMLSMDGALKMSSNKAGQGYEINHPLHLLRRTSEVS